MLKESENPPCLCPWVDTIRDLDGTWWAAHTKSRNEKALAWDLLERKIGYFLPLYERVRMSGGRKRRVMLPLFPSYVFLCSDEKGRYEAMTTNRVCQTLEVPDQEKLIRELGTIEKALKSKAELDPYPHAAEGKVCRIVSGPFEGLEGVVIRRSKVSKIVLQVSFLSMGALLEIDAGLLEP